MNFYFRTGGVVPVVAADLHRDNLQRVMDLALEESGLQMEDVDVIAVTVGPGLALCLQAGLEFVKSLVEINKYEVYDDTCILYKYWLLCRTNIFIAPVNQ